MSYDRYQLAEPVSADSHVNAMKGVMVVGTGNTVLHPFQTPNYSSGLTGYAVAGASGAAMTVTGTAQGAVVPVAIAYVGALGGNTVYRLV